MALSTVFWNRPRRPGQKTLDDGAVLRTEEKLGVKLPERLVALLRQQNGGRPQNRALRVPANYPRWMPKPFLLGDILTIDEIADQFWFDHVDTPPPGLIQFGLGDDDTFLICLHYAHSNPSARPSIVCYAPTLDSRSVFPLANTFEEFQSALFSTVTDDCYAIVSDLAKSQIWDAVVAALKLQDHPEKTWGEYPEWEAGPLPGDTGEAAQFYLETNAGVYGSVGFPGHPPGAWILHCDIQPRYRDQLSQMLKALPFKVDLVHQVDWANWQEQGR